LLRKIIRPDEVHIADIEKGDRKTIRAWVMYDWSNSVYQLTITSAIFPVYYNSVTANANGSTVSFFGLEVINTVIYSWAIAAAYFLVAVLSPLFSSVADFTGRRKVFMKTFTFIGAISCSLLFFFNGPNLEWGIIFFSLASLGYAGSLVFYNSFLPVIAEPKDHDRISARGYSMGYLGGVTLLLINLVVVLRPGWFGITDPKLPAKLAFLSVGLWWIGFSQISFRRLPKYTFGHTGERHVLMKGYRELRAVFRQVNRNASMKIYLPGYFFILMGILTIMFMSVSYGEKHLGLTGDVLIPIVLGIQFVGMAGAWGFAKLSGKIGNFKALMVATVIWIMICIGVYYVTSTVGFALAAMAVGLVMGGSQSLARSTYSKMIPETTDHTSFFSFYDVVEKLASVGGTLSFGVIEALTGNMRNSVFAIAGFFFMGFVFLLILLIRTKKDSLV
jgi:UMF1 family MFS transporter